MFGDGVYEVYGAGDTPQTVMTTKAPAVLNKAPAVLKKQVFCPTTLFQFIFFLKRGGGIPVAETLKFIGVLQNTTN